MILMYFYFITSINYEYIRPFRKWGVLDETLNTIIYLSEISHQTVFF